MKNIYIKFVITTIVICLSFFQNSSAQFGSFGTTSAEMIGMGNSAGRAFGTLAIGLNPAFLAYPRDTNSVITLQIPNVSAKALNTAMTMDDFNNYFNYPEAKDLSDAEKQDFLNAFSDTPELYFNAGSRVFGISWMPSRNIGSFAFTTTDYVAGSMSVPLTLIDLIINGNQVNRTYNFNDFNLNLWWIRTSTLSYARDLMTFDENSSLKSITGGISVKLVNGFAYAGIDEMNTYLHTGENNVLEGRVHYVAKSAFSPDLGTKYEFDTQNYPDNTSYFMKSVATGLGLDLGLAADFNFGLTMGLSVTDIGSISWGARTAQFEANGNIKIDDITDKNQQNDLEDFMKDSSYAIESFSTSLPTALRFDLAYDLTKTVEAIPGNLTLCMSYNQGFNEMPGNSTTPRISAGAYWKTLPYIPVISTGFTNDRAGNLRWAFGLGFSTTNFDIMFATQDLFTMISNGSSHYLSGSLNCIWKIGY